MSTSPPIAFERLVGDAITPWLDALAALRIRVFRDWPYLYDGDLAYERRYLETYTASPGAMVVLARIDDAVVGATTCVPLVHEDEAMRAAWSRAGFDPADVLYLGESVLLPESRGRGVYRTFMGERVRRAAELDLPVCSFCGVIRTSDDPRRPASHQDLDPVWRHYGFAPVEGATLTLNWREIGETRESPKHLQIWSRRTP